MKKNTDIKVTIPGKKEFGLSKAKQFSSKDVAKWMLSLGVELEDGTIDWY
ncbi:hypothetical protein [Mesoplasma melaleucae]|nr:hypothetical protein [Mesoplasma melaleucae]